MGETAKYAIVEIYVQSMGSIPRQDGALSEVISPWVISWIEWDYARETYLLYCHNPGVATGSDVQILKYTSYGQLVEMRRILPGDTSDGSDCDPEHPLLRMNKERTKTT